MNGRRSAPAPGDLWLLGSQGRGQLHLGPFRGPESCGVMTPHFWSCPVSLGAPTGLPALPAQLLAALRSPELLNSRKEAQILLHTG